MKLVSVLSRSPSSGQIMDLHRGGPGFDWVRIILSLSVITLHCFHIAYGANAPDLANNWSSPIWAATLPAFFAASGFMVAGSALRTRNVLKFMWFRALRILPALTVEVTLCALIFGPLVTVVTLREYFSSVETYTYFGNIVGWIHFTLPGVFVNNPRPNIVNQNLWTLHPELFCYAVMAGMMITGIVFKRGVTAIAWICFTLGVLYFQFTGREFLTGTFHSDILVYSFVSGIVFYHYRYHIRINIYLALFCVVAGYIFLKSEYPVIALPMVYYLMVFAGMTKFPRINFLQNGDYSYGLYLYGFPVQQLTVMLLPVQFREWYIVFLIAVPITLAISMVSWKYVEKPTLRLKNIVKNPSAWIVSPTEPGPEVTSAAASERA